MKKLLYMHTGSANHGCEALVRTTSKIFEGPKDVQLWSFSKYEDEYYGISKVVEKIFESEEIKRCSFSYIEALYRRKILKDCEANKKVFLRNIFKNTIAISIGGDNYCYPWSAKQAVELDKEIRKYCKFNILWGCSIDGEAITKEVEEDLKGFDLITARETITYNLLKKINCNTVLVSDPAFLLEKKDTILPKEFIENNTVGINVSPLIMKYGAESSLIMENYKNLIKYILEKTNMNICLIPHVVWKDNDDRIPCKKLYEEFKETNRLCIIQDMDCEKIKGCISKCRFFIGARTHSTIAAYSTCVPTLVVGYSVKSRGIAKDLFGDEERYVLPVQKLKNSNNLLEKFIWISENENSIKKHLQDIMPQYKRRAFEGLKMMEKLMK